MAVTLATPLPVQGGIPVGTTQSTNPTPTGITDPGGIARLQSGSTGGAANVQGSVANGNPAADNGVAVGFRSSTNAINATGNPEGQLYVNTEGQLKTFSIGGFIAPAATATDILTFVWGAGVMRLLKLRLVFAATAAGIKATGAELVKRSTLDTGGTATTPTPVPHKTSDGAASTVVNQYSANPGALGTSLGTLRAEKIAISVADGSTAIEWTFSDKNDEAAKLIAANENFAVYLGADALLTGEVISYSATFSESTL